MAEATYGRIPPDIEIAQSARLEPIGHIAAKVGLTEDDIEYYGKYKAKVRLEAIDRLKSRPYGKLIYTTAITATPAGEGKTCTAVGLTQALGKLGKKVMVALREPSLGPTFGVKGGAAGGGYSQVLPMEDINLHFTGDIHAVGAAHNLLAAMVDNHIHQGNELGIDPRRVVWRRVMDISDRQLRNIVVGLGGKANGFPMESGFDITVASEVMACLGLSRSLSDLKDRFSKLVVAYTYEGRPVTASELKAVGAMAVIMKDAIKPNLVQTLEGQPAFVHGGPFANIAYGNNSILATETALRLADYVVTEGGFAADLGAEKFFDIVCRITEVRPHVVVLVASVRALHHHGGVAKSKLAEKNLDALAKGCENLDKHVTNVTKKFGLPVVVAINRFPADDREELEYLQRHCEELGVRSAVSEVVARGGDGGRELAEAVLDALERDEPNFRFLYDLELSVKEKIEILATEIYGADGVVYAGTAERDIKVIEEQGLGGLPICMAKTQLSLSDDPSLRGAPRGWKLTVREVRASAGAGFLVPLCGQMMTMPGLPARPAAENVDIDDDGKIVGLF
ncbi:MAG: formate--tetrahydrofolate ligase [Firmicutes bacterium]|jgi:formate--tetrahydrofolate ligase|nr:formate--tetrahydrofolate ligase [Bacillota bacterium]MDH7494964.1 formate--tetrahydrofolate ligase [Bacillota bacterium]